MSSNRTRYRRQSTRLRARDYSSPGNYYVTLCTHTRQMLFGHVSEGVMHLNDVGRATDRFWNDIPLHFPQVELDEYIVMPNHVHGIIRITKHGWVPANQPVRAVGIPIVTGLSVTEPVGANDHLPLQSHSTSSRITRSKLFPLGHGTSRTIGSMVRGFKTAVTRRMRMHGWIGGVWQQNYHDHIIRNERSLERIRAYIRNNPANWHRDRNNPQRRA
jgi:putative transposase